MSKAFDTVDRSTLWILLRRYGWFSVYWWNNYRSIWNQSWIKARMRLDTHFVLSLSWSSTICKLIWTNINTKKTVTLYLPPPGQTTIGPHIKIYGTSLKSVKNFTYLGSTIASDNTIDVEINNRIRAASGAFGGLEKGVWSQRGIVISTKSRCTRRLYYQHYCTQLRRILSTVVSSENFPKCMSGIYDKSFGSHGKTILVSRVLRDIYEVHTRLEHVYYRCSIDKRSNPQQWNAAEWCLAGTPDRRRILTT